jgi:hypothetical protein
MGVKTMKAHGCTLPLPKDRAEVKSHAGAVQSGLLSRCRRLIEEKDWEGVALKLEKPIDICCWVAVAAAVIVIIPLCIRLLAG